MTFYSEPWMVNLFEPFHILGILAYPNQFHSYDSKKDNWNKCIPKFEGHDSVDVNIASFTKSLGKLNLVHEDVKMKML